MNTFHERCTKMLEHSGFHFLISLINMLRDGQMVLVCEVKSLTSPAAPCDSKIGKHSS